VTDFAEPTPVTVMVEVAVGSDRSTDLGAAVWTDVSDRATGSDVTWAVGRHGFGGQSDPSSLDLELNNDDGGITPYVTRELPIRLSVALAGDAPQEQLTAFVKSARFAYDQTGESCRVVIKATGRLDGLQQQASTVAESTDSGSSGLRGAILASGPVAYWPMEDGTSATKAASAISGVAAMSRSGTLHFGTGDGGPGSDPILDLSESGTSGSLTGTVPTTPSPTSVRFGFVATFPSGAASNDVIQFARVSTAGSIAAWWVNYSHSSPSTQLEIGYSRGDASDSFINDANATPYDGIAYWYLLELVQDGADIDVVLYRNGTALISDTVTSATLGRPTALRATSPGGSQAPAIGHYAVWVDETPSTADILAAFGISPTTGEQTSGSYDGEAASDRIQRLCEAANLPVVILPGDSSALGPQGTTSLIQALRDAEAADGGLMHDGGSNGAIVYQPRSARYNAPYALQLNIQTSRHVSAGLGAVIDDRNYTPALTVGQPAGSSATYAAVNGVEPATVTLNLADSEDLEQHAAWRVRLSMATDPALDAVPLNLAEQAELLDAWQSSDRVGFRLGITGMPDQHPTTTADQFVDGFTASTDGMTLQVDLDAVPASQYEVMPLDTETCVLSASVDADDTTWQVHHTAPPIWRDDLPQIWMQCDGERSILATDVATTAITYVSGNTVAHANNGGSLSPSLPASMQAGDLILLFAVIRDTAATVDVPTGYTRLLGSNNMALLGKIHDGSESAPTVTFTGGGANDTTSCAMFAVRGTIQDIDHVMVEWAEWSNPSASGVEFPPLAAPRYDGCIVFYFLQQAATWTSIASTGYTEVLDSASALGDDQSVAAGYIIQTAAAAITAGSFATTGGSSAVSRALLVAFAPGLQTLTVTRGTPAASHSAGDQVRVDRIGNLAL
jgi:hypothetical protein